MVEEIQITEKELDVLKVQVLNEKIDDICEQLGDPGRYFASFKAKDLLSQSDCEEIKSEKTSIERSRVLIEKVQGRHGRHNEHPYDVFVGALKRMRVHVHIVRILNSALAAKREELRSAKRTSLVMEEFNNGFPSNGISPSIPPQGPYSAPNDLISKGPLPASLLSNTSSPISSSSSSHGTTPPLLSSPQTDTDGSLLSPPSIPSSYEMRQSPMTSSALPLLPTTAHLPTLPVGYNELGQRVKNNPHSNYSRSNSQTTPIVSEISNPIPPPLPPGFGFDGQRIDNISELITSNGDTIHPSHGTLPPIENQPEVALPQRTHSDPDENTAIVNELNLLVNRLQTELKISKETLVQCRCEIKKLRQQNEELIDDNKRLISAKNQLESQMSIMNGTSPMRSSSNNSLGTPHSKYSPSNNWQSTNPPQMLNNRGKRNTEPHIINSNNNTYDFRSYSSSVNHHHRQSEPNTLNIPTRPNKLPLNKNNRTTPNLQSSSYDHSPLYDGDSYLASYLSRQSPGSDAIPRERGMRNKMTSSGDDLTSGGEDRNSVRSFESGNSGNVTLTTGQNTTETIV